MKCPMCDGRRTMFTREQPGVGTQFGEIKLVVCPKCNGTGEVDENSRPILTNEEWFCSLPTKEKAKEMCVIMADMAEANDGVWDEEMIEDWLKEKHHE